MGGGTEKTGFLNNILQAALQKRGKTIFIPMKYHIKSCFLDRKTGLILEILVSKQLVLHIFNRFHCRIAFFILRLIDLISAQFPRRNLYFDSHLAAFILD